MSSASNHPEIPLRVLIIDDDTRLCRLVRDYLMPFGYQVSACHDGLSGLEEARSGRYDVILLDVMMPRLDGFNVLKEIRKSLDVPVLMLTARGDEADRIVGLEIGADDYLPKTFSTRELLARLRAVTRRRARPGRDEETTIEADGLRIDRAAYRAELDGGKLQLTRVEFSILSALMTAPGRVLSRTRLCEEVAGRDWEAFDRSIDVHVAALRKKLGDDARHPRFIRTIRGVGYAFGREES
jgi:two-component system response regulator CpxR